MSAIRLGTLRNVVVAGNMAIGSSGVETGIPGGFARGGGIHAIGGDANLDGVTIANNQAIAGLGGEGQADGTAQGGGIFAGGSGFRFASSILADNISVAADGVETPEDCFYNGPSFVAIGYNLVEAADPSCEFDGPGDQVGIDPGLYPLADFGCAATLPNGECVPTLAIDQSSPAADAGSCARAVIFEDSRDLPRPFDLPAIANRQDGCDSGAFEAMDADGDGFTEAADCAPDDPSVNALDRCGICGGDGMSCPMFEDGFESGNTDAWSSVQP